MQFSHEQDGAITKITVWRKDSEQCFLLTGAAGTGKSTIAKAAGEGENVLFCSPTGKGADALRKRSGVEASTVHKVLYKSPGGHNSKLAKLAQKLLAAEASAKPNIPEIQRLRGEIRAMRARAGGPKWEVPKDALIKGADLVVVDECFMLSAQIIKDLRDNAKKILFLGDPYQLPPVAGACPLVEQWADVHLDQIHRQAMENPVLRAATKMRETGIMETVSTDAGENGAYRYLQKDQTTWEDYRAVEQIIVARNATRRGFNANYRRRLGYETPLVVGDRLIFLTNSHEMEIFNGSVGTLDSFGERSDNEFDITVDLDDGCTVPAVPAWNGPMYGLEPREGPRDMMPIDYSYAITCHKAQGSEYKSVLVYDEGFGDKETWRRWNYTATTRARQSCTVVNAVK